MTNGTSQSISVNTGGTRGASCLLANNSGSWKVSTPGTISVDRSVSDLAVTCQKGESKGSTNVNAAPSMAAAGNILLPGGLLGGAIDVGTGAAFKYPERIDVILK